MSELVRHTIFDNIHGNMHFTRVERRVIESAYLQRLRWIKQLGFSFYIYPGATHTRLAHALGVSHIMHRLLHNLGLSVPDEKLFNPKINDEPTQFHRTMRLAAMLHDVGTFPFSHSVEFAYISHWKKQKQHGKKNLLSANHETLGSHIILNTDFSGGITRILKEEGIDPKELSDIIAGKSANLLANQLLHSDIDVDRMDYLLRDAFHTGVKLGLFDLDFLIRSLTIGEVKGQKVMCVQEDSMNAAEYFLICRYSWYSQIINDGTGYKFDLMAAKIGEYFLENGIIYSFDQLMNQVSLNPMSYFTFNDSYFLAKIHDFLSGQSAHPVVRELCQMLAMRIAPKQIRLPPLTPTLVQGEEHRAKLVKEVTTVFEWLEEQIHKYSPNAWIIFDIPSRDVLFTKSKDMIQKTHTNGDALLMRDPIRILTRKGEVKLLVDEANSLMKVLSPYRNFIPRVYVSSETYQSLADNGVLAELMAKK